MPTLLQVPFFALMLWLGIAPAQAQQEDWQPVSESWYVVTLGGARVGWSLERVERAGQRERTTQEAVFSVARGPAVVRLATNKAFVESLDGKPISVDLLVEAGQEPMEQRWVFQPDGILERSRGQERLHPNPSVTWLTPGQRRALWRQVLTVGGDQLQYYVIEPEMGTEAWLVEANREGSETFTSPDGPVEASIWSYRDSAQGLEGHLWVDGQGRLLQEEIPTGIGTTLTRLATQEEALAPLEQVPEVMAASFVKADVPAAPPAGAMHAVMRVCSTTGALDPLPSAGAQRVSRDGEDCLMLDVDVQRRSRVQRRVRRDPAFLAASSMLEVDDPVMAQLLTQALGAPEGRGQPDSATAEALRAFVGDYIIFSDTSTPLASAGETARSRSGDCTEHAVLLCALLRAAGIPARVASGLVYADTYLGEEHVFVWHMWTQAILDGRWVDLDATLQRPFNPLHVLTSTSALSSGLIGVDSASDSGLMGSLSIQVLSLD